MVQHLLLGMLAPVGLVLGAPVTLLLRAGPTSVRRALVRMLRTAPVPVLAHPMTAAVLSTGGMFLVLLTPLYAAAERHEPLHQGVHLHYLAAGYLFAWAIAGPDAAPRRPGLPARVVTLLAAAAGHAILAKYLYAHAGAVYPNPASMVAPASTDPNMLARLKAPMLTEEARAGAWPAVCNTQICSGGIVANAATPNRTIAATNATWLSAATATIADTTVSAPTGPDAAGSTARSARRPPSRFPATRPTPSGT